MKYRGKDKKRVEKKVGTCRERGKGGWMVVDTEERMDGGTWRHGEKGGGDKGKLVSMYGDGCVLVDAFRGPARAKHGAPITGRRLRHTQTARRRDNRGVMHIKKSPRGNIHTYIQIEVR